LTRGGGSIVQTSSGAAISPSDGKRPAYGASESAVNALVRHVAKNWGPRGVRCNGVMPGLVMGETQRRQADTALQEMFDAEPALSRLREGGHRENMLDRSERGRHAAAVVRPGSSMSNKPSPDRCAQALDAHPGRREKMEPCPNSPCTPIGSTSS
jgi:NAD(P)-dependent dehydrogenase (short-subunit alcohol dehydrogenase family)